MVGYDDVPIAGHCRIRLTTVRSDAAQMGGRAVELLVEAARQRPAREPPRAAEQSPGDPLDDREAATVSAVRYEAVEKRFDPVVALRALDLHVPDHAFLALLGPSGCGKTTALRILAGLEEPSTGRVLIGERDVTRLQPRDRDVAMVFQSYALYPHMTVAENIAYPLRIRKVAAAELARKIADVTQALEIDHLLGRYPRQLSGGQRQRIALARAIVRDPAAFLMDEPLSNLDARLRLSMRGEIKRLCHSLGATTLYVTHDQAEALTMADLIAVLRDGELQQVAPPDEIYDRPANRFVALFVGQPGDESVDRRGRRRRVARGRLHFAPERGTARRPASPAPLARQGSVRKTCASPTMARPMGSGARSTSSSPWGMKRSSRCGSAMSG